MVCNSYLRSLIVRAGRIGILTKRRVQISNTRRSLHACVGVSYTWNCEFRRSFKMMVDSSGAAAKRGPIVDILPEKEDDGGYVSGGWKRWLWVNAFDNICVARGCLGFYCICYVMHLINYTFLLNCIWIEFDCLFNWLAIYLTISVPVINSGGNIFLCFKNL